jgi:NADH-quinone oxidoreductase subunit N
VNLPELGSPLVLEGGLGVLMLIVFFVGLFMPSEDKRRVGVLAGIGLVVLLGVSLRTEPGTELFRGLQQDELALFAKRLFLLATLLGVLASLPLRAVAFARRATEYYLAILASLLGMLVLSSARDLILLFVAFELMSIPLYYLAGFLKREPEAVEAALKFFLVGTVSSAVCSLSFVYGIAGTTDLRGIGARCARPSSSLRICWRWGARLQDRGVPLSHVGADAYGRRARRSWPGCRWRRSDAAGFVIFRLYLEAWARGAPLGAAAAGLATLTIIAGNLMASAQNIKRLLAYSGIAHIGYMLIGFAAVSPRRASR